ncbi:precorrin-4 C(11)-methyltransferase [Fusobacterium necrophorum]|uniref:Cobalt-precorrin-4 C(11)-methyltransferase n=1 Tax=Fusobacterium necrophorum DJ-2 TaxID=1441737 RepID=A0AB73C4A7_9FUSO|nr:precorrin-4 C(11)-methyltransferase [Fusobacterium necrophorum]KDE68093.1 cobalt-precorrin-4 C(11)-methyltransferase [Fusobacterium necrophorum BFTR-2]KDE70934.1 cobalt-precorrin-4 C(11)-methyltransferase [Fusobacterium necrophorum DAB]KDE72829.1 cobalt-precorrin-4 C(11)-methyltransferase [Fusobacterium necrophorum DJ-2]MCF0161147.1 precorrin-4 C(11)-methyltransferase [Fusobacterium necrophorum]
MEKYQEKVYFIGAGPGDPELITVKGQRLVKEADIIIYAGSLVPKQVIDCHKEGAEIYNSASMTLEEVVSVMKEGIFSGKKVARVHTGDPAIFGAHREQMDLLDEYGIDYEVIPGVSSFLASAAAIKKEFTLPNISQTVICTRLEGRTPVPERESLESLASHRASMAIFLSVHMIGEVVKRLETSYPKETPIAVVQRATWEDQKIVMGTLENIEVKVREAKIEKTAQILVGDFLGNEYEKSKLYDKYFTHEYRKGIKQKI